LLLACGDNSIKKWDLASNQVMTVGEHQAPVKEVCSILVPSNNMSVVISGGWDAKVKFWSW
jgi:mRNA export factor